MLRYASTKPRYFDNAGKLIETLVGKPTLVELTETKPPVLATNRPRGSALLEASFGAQFCVGGSPRASFGTQRALLTRDARAGDRPSGVGCLQVRGRRRASAGEATEKTCDA